MAETSELFPTSPEPSILVSLGTGSGSTSRNSRKYLFGKNSFPYRVYGAFCKQGESASVWESLVEQIRVRARGQCFRFDVDLGDWQPALDDVNCMETMARMARESALGSTEMARLAKSLRAELFVFELDPSHLPELVSGVYQCTGYVVCRLRADTPEFGIFMHQLKSASAILRCQRRSLLEFQAQMINAEDGRNFYHEVHFQVSSRQHEINITLQEGEIISNIGGSPSTIEQLCRQQQLETCFGTDDHRKRSHGDGLNLRRKLRRLS